MQPNSIETIAALIGYGIDIKQIDPFISDDSVKTYAHALFNSKQCKHQDAIDKFECLAVLYKSNVDLSLQIGSNLLATGNYMSSTQYYSKVSYLI